MLNKLRELASDSATYGASQMLGQLIGLVLIPVYTQHLSPTDYGIMAMLAFIPTIFNTIANLGMTNAIFRHFNREKEASGRQRVLSTGLLSVIGSSAVLLILGLLLTNPINVLLFGKSETTYLVQLTLLTGLLQTIGQVPIVVLRAERRVKIASVLNVCSLLISISTTIWLVVFLQLGILGLVLGNLIAELVMIGIRITFTSHYFRFLLDYKIWKEMLDYGLPFLPHRIQTAVLAMFGQYVVGSMIGLNEVGLYSIAVRFAMPVSFIVGSVQQAWVPYKFQIHANDADPASVFRSIMNYYVAVTLYLWVGVSLWGTELVRLMTPPEFHTAGALVSWVALVSICQGLYFMFGTGFELDQNTKPMPLVSLAGLISVVVFSYILVPLFGAIGATIASSLGWVAMSIVIYSLSSRRFPIVYDWSTLIASVGSAIGFVAIGYLGISWDVLPRIGLYTSLSILYPIVVYLILIRSDSEQIRMQQLWSKMAQLRRI